MSTITIMPCPFCEALKAEIASLKSRESPEDAWNRAYRAASDEVRKVLFPSLSGDLIEVPPYTPPK